jgi:hypothetical protein
MEAGGAALAAELGGLRLVVEAASHGDGAVRFLVRRVRDGERSAGALIGSGMRATVAEAMRAAERVANRLAP